MNAVRKVCPVVARNAKSTPEILAFLHPVAGKQLVKGTIRNGEEDEAAAKRELCEESGIGTVSSMVFLGRSTEIAPNQEWSFWLCAVPPQLDRWTFRCGDDGGHFFQFFWQPLWQRLGHEWHPVFVRAVRFVRDRLDVGKSPRGAS
ncbi:MAG: NUDIX domain-containing protein [Pseudomonadota bacterium]